MVFQYARGELPKTDKAGEVIINFALGPGGPILFCSLRLGSGQARKGTKRDTRPLKLARPRFNTGRASNSKRARIYGG